MTPLTSQPEIDPSFKLPMSRFSVYDQTKWTAHLMKPSSPSTTLYYFTPVANSSFHPYFPSSSMTISSYSSISFGATNTCLHLPVLPIIIVIISTVIFTFSRITKSYRKRFRLPPGPPGWPLVGNLFQVALSRKPFFQYVREIIPSYGPIFTLGMGSRTMIIISDATLVHEALVEKGLLFANRPAENPTRAVFSNNKFTVNAALYGPLWRSLRRNMVQNALTTSRLREFSQLRAASMDKLVKRLQHESDVEGTVLVLKNARYAVFCILLSMCFGLEMDEATVDKVDQMMKTVLMTLDPRIDDYLPLLRPLFWKQRKKALTVRKQQIETLVPFIEKRKKVLKDPRLDPSAASFSYLDTLLHMEIEGRSAALNDEEMVTLCSEFINGGTDTTATALEWAVARLIDNPSTQSKLHREIRSTVGERKVEEKDLEGMKYLNAFTKELLRKHPPTYFSLTHTVLEPCKLGGYDIPPGSNVEFYLPGISEDERIWSLPEKFDPERFLCGGEDADMSGVGGLKMIPFGVGRRICPGLGMAMIHINLMIARMVQEFEWTASPANSKIDFREKSEFTVVMNNSLRAAVKKRST